MEYKNKDARFERLDNVAYELLVEKDVDLSKLGFGDNLVVEFDPERCMLRVSVFEESHFKFYIYFCLS